MPLSHSENFRPIASIDYANQPLAEMHYGGFFSNGQGNEFAFLQTSHVQSPIICENDCFLYSVSYSTDHRTFRQANVREIEPVACGIDDMPAVAYPADVADDIIRDAILAEVHRRKLTAYGVWKLVEGKVGRTTIHQFLLGTDETAMTTQTATHLLNALGLTLKSKK